MSGKELGWYPKHVASYRSKTGQLTALQHGVYNLLLDEYWANRGPLPNVLSYLCRVALMSQRSHRALDVVLAAFFTLTDGHWHNKRADEELALANHVYTRRSAAAQATNAILGRDGTRHGKRPVPSRNTTRPPHTVTVSRSATAAAGQYNTKKETLPSTTHSPRATAALGEPIAHEVGKVASKEVVAAIVRRFTTEPGKRDNLPAIIDAAPVPAVIIEAEQQPVFEGKSLQHVREWAWSSKGASYYHAAFDDIDKPTTNADMRALAEFTVLKAYEKAHAS